MCAKVIKSQKYYAAIGHKETSGGTGPRPDMLLIMQVNTKDSKYKY